MLIVGDTGRREFRTALGDATACATADEAAALLERGECAPEVIVLVEARPGEIAQAAVDRLRRLAPLARIVGLLGSWCEGETRTGRPWPGVIRLYWHQWRPRARLALEQLAAAGCSPWALPATATDEERLLCAAERPLPTRAGLVAVHTASFETAEFLLDACGRCGYAPVWVRPGQALRMRGAAAGIFDVRELDAREQDRLRAFADALRPAPVVLLMDFPRIDDFLAASAAGAAAVLSKPLTLDDLWDALQAGAAS